MFLVRILVASFLFVLIGRGARRGAGGGLHESTAGRLALDWTLGLAVATPILFFLARLSWPVNAAGVVAACGLLAVLLAVVPARRPHPTQTAPEPLPADWLSLAVLLAALALFAWKVWQAPLWSWDHYAAWGVTARRLIEDGRLGLSFLRLASFLPSHPDNPLGLPLAWRLLGLGATPDAAAFKACHVLFGLALAALVRDAARESGAPPPAANALAAFAAVSPLFWDTEAAGLAEMPLALVAAAGFLLLLKSRDRRAPPISWTVGWTLGFLPWIKGREGLTLAILAGAAGTLWLARQRLPIRETARRLLVPLALSAGSGFAAFSGLPAGERFLAGDWKSRGIARLHEAPKLLGALARDLLRADWLGFWVLFAAATAVFWLMKRRGAALLSAVVWGQLAIYSAVYFVTYLDPGAHIKSSFFRISAALVPLAAIAMAALFSPSPPIPSDSREHGQRGA